MALVRWSPWQGLFDVERDMDRLMKQVFGSLGTSDSGLPVRDAWVPAVEVFARDGDLVVRAELPGIDPEKDVDISFQEGVLTIRGERRAEHRDEGNGTFRSEVSYGSFRRSILLPEGVKEEDIRATYEDGILEVVVPKAGDLGSPKRIPVHTGRGRKALTTRGRKTD